MLKKIVIENFLSIRNRVEIDFTKTSYTILPQNVNEDKILKGAIFVGANASGKTNVLKAVSYLQQLLFKDWRDGEIFYAKCLFSPDKVFELKYQFLIDGCEVRYQVKVDAKEKMIFEKLEVNKHLLLERKGKMATSYINDKNGINYSEDVPEDSIFLRAIYFNTKFSGNKVLMDWMEFLKKSAYCDIFRNQLLSAKREEFSLKKYFESNGEDKINHFFKLYNFEQEVEYDNKVKGNHYKIESEEKMIFFRRKSLNDPIPMSIESLGNKNLLKLLPLYLEIIEEGGMLIIDEFSSGFHNDLEELLVRHFMKHSKNSQLFLVSHSTNLLKNSVFRPDQEYSVYFDGANGSILRRFSEEQPRNAQNIEKMYNSGVFGGLPNYEVTEFEDK